MPSDGEDVERSLESVSLESIPLHSTNLLTLLDAEGIVRYESPAIERIFGFDQRELVGEPVAEYFHPEDRQAVVSAFQRLVESDESRTEAVEFRHQAAEGDYVWVEATASSSPTPEGHYVVNTREIGQRRERERALRETNERLGTLTSVLGHDLRNPLSVARGRLELARAGTDPLPADVAEHLDVVDQAHDRMEQLIDDLLTLAGSDGAVDDPDPVDLGDVATACWETVATGDATLECRVECRVLADRSRLRQLLENLVRNAVEHGGSAVTVAIGPCEDADGFYVADDGQGIPPEDREAVFEGGYTTGESGTGLGLAIVEDVADAHDWNVALGDSQWGGARFEITGVGTP